MGKVYKHTLGVPEQIVPSLFKEESKIELSDKCSFNLNKIEYKETNFGCSIEFSLEDEEIFGFGLQLKKVCHRGTKKTIRVNADPLTDSGDSHAPVPFFVTNKGYGMYFDTARYVSFYCGKTYVQKREVKENKIAMTTEELYAAKKEENSNMLIEIPVAKGIDMYIIEGDDILDIVSTYNMLSGGGCMPPLWGMGVLYRCYGKSNSDEIMEFANYFREHHIPCDIIGLEPGWQSKVYSCSYLWSKERFSDWENMIVKLKEKNYNINLWEHAFINSESKIYDEMKHYCGNYEVWEGLVPDFAKTEAIDIFSEYHQKEFVKKGISGFKLDECDSSDFTGGWSFPNSTAFPSGIDGEQMHNMFGVLYQRALNKSFGNKRTLSQVRSSGAFASQYPFVLYSDLYDHKDFIRGCVNSGFSGLLWSPELRGASSAKDMIRRMQTVVFSAQVVLNQWNQEIPPWIKWDVVDAARDILNIRMSLIPYLYSVFYDYYTTGKPPVSALACRFDKDIHCFNIDDEYMLGDSMLIAPMTENEDEREVYLPQGRWYDFWDNTMYTGGEKIKIKTDNIPVFISENSIIPWAEPVEYIDNPVFEITLKCYGYKGRIKLIQDDGLTYSTSYEAEEVSFIDNEVKHNLSKTGRYKIISTEFIK